MLDDEGNFIMSPSLKGRAQRGQGRGYGFYFSE